MTSLRQFKAADMFRFNNVNLDPLTETYNVAFYLQYLGRWPEYCHMALGPHGRPMGYILGKSEFFGDNKPESWHGHVTAVTVAPEARRLGLATQLMTLLEHTAERVDNCYFVDLFVRESNKVAVEMYRKFGYSIYRQVIGYYSGEEDAYDMRKALSRDVDKKSIIPLPNPVHPSELDG
jgi:N-terminal acetyltransferase B complex catalytic subunit